MFLSQLHMNHNFVALVNLVRAADHTVEVDSHRAALNLVQNFEFLPPHAHSRRRLWGTPGSYLNFRRATTLSRAATSSAERVACSSPQKAKSLERKWQRTTFLAKS